MLVRITERIIRSHIYKILSKIQLEDLTVIIENQAEAYAPLVGNNLTDVTYQNPFGFSLTAIAVRSSYSICLQRLRCIFRPEVTSSSTTVEQTPPCCSCPLPLFSVLRLLQASL